ncbi:hypothetical protein ACQ86O_18980 [Serratia sp. L9]|uniref:hypothetical protein n=1 Tax=Serratia sp. L9 TaxID=3423946 RepID=UPI003D67BB6E
MNPIIVALTVLFALPLTLHAKQAVSTAPPTGGVSFSGKISAPTCTVSPDSSGQYISTCYRETARKTNAFIQMPLDKMTSELMVSPIREIVFNNPSLQRITLIYN